MRRAAAIAMMAPLAMGLGPAAGPAPIDLPGEHLHPESVSISADGTAYVSSVTGGVLRVSLASGQTVQWIKPGDFGSGSIFGVLVDSANGVLWVCNNDVSWAEVTVSGADKGTYLKAFDLKSGEGRLSYKLPGDNAFCNDMAMGKDGVLYVTETNGSRILRLRPGAKSLEEWQHDPALGALQDGAGLDGIAFGSDGNLYVNNYKTHVFARVALNADGSAGKTTLLQTSRPLEVPDGLRPLGGMRFVQAENGGRIGVVTVKGDKAEVETRAEGLSSPTSVDAHDGTLWFVQGELKYVFNPRFRRQTPPPFKLTPVSAGN